MLHLLLIIIICHMFESLRRIRTKMCEKARVHVCIEACTLLCVCQPLLQAAGRESDSNI